MEQQERTENTTIGLHRPFNMPLKSLVWVCRFANCYKQKKNHDFYIDFFLWMLEEICNHTDNFDENNAEGIIRPQNAQKILCLFTYHHYDEIKALVRSTLNYRPQEDDKLIYSTYKNTSYYITLAKNVELVNGRGELNPLGEKLVHVRDYRFFELSDKHRLVIFRALYPAFFDKLIVISQSQRLIKTEKKVGTEFFRKYLKKENSEGLIRYITSFDKNYLVVLRHWVEALRFCTEAGNVRSMYLKEIDRLGLTDKYNGLINKSEAFFSGIFKEFVKQEKRYSKIRSSYEHYKNHGLAEFGYVNLYDIKKNFHFSFETFNDLLNSYYTQNRHKEIILFSNTVSSIDKRRRFIVDGQAVLKIRIIKKN